MPRPVPAGSARAPKQAVLPEGFSAISKKTDPDTGLPLEIRCGRDGSEMVLIPAGKYWMGSPEGEGGADEHPRHEVYLDAYYMDKYEVTNGQYMKFVAETGKHHPEWLEPGSEKNVETGNNGYYKRLGSALSAADHPVVGVSWDDAEAYCRWAGKRLPTEAEWEKAARGGSVGKWSFGDDESRMGEHAWFSDNAGGKTHAVGGRKPNAFGLYDMVGNVWEWPQDWYHRSYNGAPTDGSAWESPAGSSRVLRGGCWGDDARHARSALRGHYDPGYRSIFIGFRPAR